MFENTNYKYFEMYLTLSSQFRTKCSWFKNVFYSLIYNEENARGFSKKKLQRWFDLQFLFTPSLVLCKNVKLSSIFFEEKGENAQN